MARPKECFHIFSRHFAVWYDRSQRSWVMQELDGEGNQMEGADYAPSRDLALIGVGIRAAGAR